MKNQATIHDISVARGYPSFATLSTDQCPVKRMRIEPDQLASLAHEIRNPLSTINLSAEMLRSFIIDEDQKLFLEMIVRGSMRINDILSGFHSSLRGEEMHATKYSIHQLLDEVLGMAVDKITLKHISIRKDYDVKDSKIRLNGPQMKVALTNIIINAVDAMTAGKGTLTLITKSTVHACIIRIIDNGCGISPKNLKNIFEPYFTSKPGGLGLGLATTREILRSNHVRVNVRSTEAKGSSFTLTFKK